MQPTKQIDTFVKLKPGPAFRLSTYSKRLLGMISDKSLRDHYKGMLIQGELAAAIKPKKEKD